MSDGYEIFVQLENPVVKIDGIRAIRNYLEKVIPFWKNYPVIKFTTVGAEVFVHFVNETRGKPQKQFFGYLEDVAMNIQNGMYEPKEVDG